MKFISKVHERCPGNQWVLLCRFMHVVIRLHKQEVLQDWLLVFLHIFLYWFGHLDDTDNINWVLCDQSVTQREVDDEIGAQVCPVRPPWMKD